MGTGFYGSYSQAWFYCKNIPHPAGGFTRESQRERLNRRTENLEFRLCFSPQNMAGPHGYGIEGAD
jgi:hypothetical protein